MYIISLSFDDGFEQSNQKIADIYERQDPAGGRAVGAWAPGASPLMFPLKNIVAEPLLVDTVNVFPP